MPWWLLVAIFGSIGLTALLMGVLSRINAPPRERNEDRKSGGD